MSTENEKWLRDRLGQTGDRAQLAFTDKEWDRVMNLAGKLPRDDGAWLIMHLRQIDCALVELAERDSVPDQTYMRPPNDPVSRAGGHFRGDVEKT